jgi:uncharacterized membrane protein
VDRPRGRAPGPTLNQRLLAAFFMFAGSMHFVIPARYEAIMPPYVPAHRAMVQVSGVAEWLGGAAVLAPELRPTARWWLIALLVAVFPANLYMATDPDRIEGLERVPRWLLWARLPLQPLAIWWVWRATASR